MTLRGTHAFVWCRRMHLPHQEVVASFDPAASTAAPRIAAWEGVTSQPAATAARPDLKVSALCGSDGCGMQPHDGMAAGAGPAR